MLVKDVMTPSVKTITPQETVQEAGRLMRDMGLACLIVVDKGKLVGIITEMDLVKGVIAEDKKASLVKIKEVMTKEVIMIDPEATVEEAAEVMTDHKVKKLPVVQDSKLIGLLTSMDIVASEPKFIEQLSQLFLMPKPKKPIAG
ncbi:MAG: CBS domain-containing protein [Candidatus Aenigmatarchaeota archaeon]